LFVFESRSLHNETFLANRPHHGLLQGYRRIDPAFFERIALNVTLGLLNRLSQHNSGSEQFLAFGLHIRAQKQG